MALSTNNEQVARQKRKQTMILRLLWPADGVADGMPHILA